MLALDDPRWLSLDHRGWVVGKRYKRDHDAPFVPDELRRLMANPVDHDRFWRLWPYLCSEGTAWPAAYAAVPYLVAIARRLRPEQRGYYLYVVGLVVMCSGPYGNTPHNLPDDIAAAYRLSLPDARTLLTQQLAEVHGLVDTLHLLAATAALKGHTELGNTLNDLDEAIGGSEAR